MLNKLRGLFSGFRLWDVASARVVKSGTMLVAMTAGFLMGWVASGFRVWGTFKVVCVDPSGNIKWTGYAPNVVVNVGLNYILNSALGGATQITTWYLGLVDNAGTPTLAAGDTHAVHAWTELVAYTQANRVAWTPATSTAQSITNTSTSNFSMNATKTVKGLFLSNDNNKSGVSGASTLFSEAAFSGGNQTVNSGDTLQVTYTVNSASS